MSIEQLTRQGSQWPQVVHPSRTHTQIRTAANRLLFYSRRDRRKRCMCHEQCATLSALARCETTELYFLLILSS